LRGVPSNASEVKFGADLQDARIIRGKDSAKVAGINAAGGILKLCVIKDIECLKTKLDQSCFAEFCSFGQGHVPVVQTRAMEEATVRIADLPQALFREQGRIEVGIAVSRVGVIQNPAGSEIGLVGSSRTCEGTVPTTALS